MSAAEARAVLRSLLRAVDRNITSATGNRHWRDFVIAEFRRGEALGSSDERQAALQDARDYAVLVDSVREHKVRPAAHSVLLCRRCRRLRRLPPAACCPAWANDPAPPRCAAHRSCCCPTTSASRWTSARRT